MKPKYHIAKPVQQEITVLEERDISREAGRTVTDEDVPKLLEIGNAAIRAMSGEHGVFSGPYPNAYALAHHQIEKDHLRAFFVRVDVAFAFFNSIKIIANPSWSPADTVVREQREGCMTHGGRGDRKVRRFALIDAEFDEIVDGRLQRRTMRLDRMAAQIFQHETEHCDGKTIYSDKMPACEV